MAIMGFQGCQRTAPWKAQSNDRSRSWLAVSYSSTRGTAPGPSMVTASLDPSCERVADQTHFPLGTARGLGQPSTHCPERAPVTAPHQDSNASTRPMQHSKCPRSRGISAPASDVCRSSAPHPRAAYGPPAAWEAQLPRASCWQQRCRHMVDGNSLSATAHDHSASRMAPSGATVA